MGIDYQKLLVDTGEIKNYWYNPEALKLYLEKIETLERDSIIIGKFPALCDVFDGNCSQCPTHTVNPGWCSTENNYNYYKFIKKSIEKGLLNAKAE